MAEKKFKVAPSLAKQIAQYSEWGRLLLQVGSEEVDSPIVHCCYPYEGKQVAVCGASGAASGDILGYDQLKSAEVCQYCVETAKSLTAPSSLRGIKQA